MTEGFGHNSKIDGALNAFVDRVEDRRRDQLHAAEDIKEILTEAKSAGFMPKHIRRIANERLMDASKKAQREADEAEYELYMRQLGM